MPRCHLAIELDRSGPIFRPAERISGRVRVRSEAGARCRRLIVGAAWKVTGGTPDGELSEAQTLFQGEWKPGTDVSHSFDFSAPLGPVSYRGELLWIHWYVVARAELARAFRAVESAYPISLRPWADGELLPHTGDYRSRPASAPSGYDFGSRKPKPKPSYDAAYGRLPFEADASALGRALQNGWARMRLGGRPLIDAPREARLGQRLQIRVRSKARERLARVEARLLAQEVDIAKAALAHFDLVDAVPDAGDWVVSFLIPASAPPTFSSRNADVRWNLQLTCTAVGGATWCTELPLIVTPAQGPMLTTSTP